MMSEFEKQVRHALIDRDMTMTDLANELGITISYVSDLLKGKRTNQEQLQRIKSSLKSLTQMIMKNRISVSEVAELMNVSEQFIRIGLQKIIYSSILYYLSREQYASGILLKLI